MFSVNRRVDMLNAERVAFTRVVSGWVSASEDAPILTRDREAQEHTTHEKRQMKTLMPSSSTVSRPPASCDHPCSSQMERRSPCWLTSDETAEKLRLERATWLMAAVRLTDGGLSGGGDGGAPGAAI